MTSTSITEFTKQSQKFSRLVGLEIFAIRERHGPIASESEAIGVIAEEVAEFFDEVRKKREHRDRHNMLVELVQIAGVACRADVDLSDSEREVRACDVDAILGMELAALADHEKSDPINSAHDAYGLLFTGQILLLSDSCLDDDAGEDSKFLHLAAVACRAAVDLNLVNP